MKSWACPQTALRATSSGRTVETHPDRNRGGCAEEEFVAVKAACDALLEAKAKLLPAAPKPAADQPPPQPGHRQAEPVQDDWSRGIADLCRAECERLKEARERWNEIFEVTASGKVTRKQRAAAAATEASNWEDRRREIRRVADDPPRGQRRQAPGGPSPSPLLPPARTFETEFSSAPPQQRAAAHHQLSLHHGAKTVRPLPRAARRPVSASPFAPKTVLGRDAGEQQVRFACVSRSVSVQAPAKRVFA
ncbi:hypothetical protein DIPPA_22966 [Diplonema papillatum]|nr:hypothetical protein DIPPA_22966 [Diplonema papillatum]